MNAQLPEQSPNGQERYYAFLNSVSNLESSNLIAYDKAILALAGAALTLSLAFTKDLVPLNTARHVWLLFASWGGFVLTLLVNISGFMISIRHAQIQKSEARKWLRRIITEDDLQSLLDRHSDRMYKWIFSQGVAFMLAMICFASYVWSNTLSESQAKVAAPCAAPTTATAAPAHPALPAVAPAAPTSNPAKPGG